MGLKIATLAVMADLEVVLEMAGFMGIILEELLYQLVKEKMGVAFRETLVVEEGEEHR
jgi:hypothetical protein